MLHLPLAPSAHPPPPCPATSCLLTPTARPRPHRPHYPKASPAPVGHLPPMVGSAGACSRSPHLPRRWPQVRRAADHQPGGGQLLDHGAVAIPHGRSHRLCGAALRRRRRGLPRHLRHPARHHRAVEHGPDQRDRGLLGAAERVFEVGQPTCMARCGYWRCRALGCLGPVGAARLAGLAHTACVPGAKGGGPWRALLWQPSAA
jgi:hypothetical protein